jgi:hypothetical protein
MKRKRMTTTLGTFSKVIFYGLCVQDMTNLIHETIKKNETVLRVCE